MGSQDRPVAAPLLRAIGLKAAIEILLLCAVAATAAFINFKPLLRGAVDVADSRTVAGWVSDPSSPGEQVEVHLYIDGHFAASARAGRNREDLVRAGAASDPNHGFSFDLAKLGLSSGPHRAEVFAVRPSSSNGRVLIPVSKRDHVLTID